MTMNRLASVSTNALRIAGMALLVSALVTSSVAMTGCTSMRPVKPMTNPAGPASWKVKTGDHLEVRLRDGRRVSFTVASVDASGIAADDGTRYEARDVIAVKRRKFSVLKTSLLGLGGFLVFVAIAALSYASGY